MPAEHFERIFRGFLEVPYCVIISELSRRDTIIVNFQFSIVNSAKPFKQQFTPNSCFLSAMYFQGVHLSFPQNPQMNKLVFWNKFQKMHLNLFFVDFSRGLPYNFHVQLR